MTTWYDLDNGTPASVKDAKGKWVTGVEFEVSSRATILQDLWGPEAGGHDGIAGSPRERRMTEDDLEAAVTALAAKLNAPG